MTQAQQLIDDLTREAAKTRKTLEACPDQHFAHKPHEKSMTFGALVGHVAEGPEWIPSMMDASLDLAAMGDYTPFVPSTTAEALASFDASLAKSLEILAGRSDEFMDQSWTMTAGDTVMMSARRGDVVRDIGIHHMIHHRGQLTTHMRLLDVPVPPTYGPTADFPDVVGS